MHRRGTLDRPASLRDATPGNLRELELMTGETVTGADRGYRLFDAYALAAKGDWPAARELAQIMVDQQRKFVTDEPTSSGSWARLGLAEALLGRRDEALRCALKALELKPAGLRPLRQSGASQYPPYLGQ